MPDRSVKHDRDFWDGVPADVAVFPCVATDDPVDASEGRNDSEQCFALETVESYSAVVDD